ncbi:MAG TPA: glycosyltransferase family 39 protein [Candidatus Udaeobacter sp.]|nr:glycosyltransferase family 39 protein [Candidatus Udaeobacter sp.]
MDRSFRPLPALLVIFALSLATRLLCLPAVREDNLTPDGARFLNLARAISRGEGFSTPEAWPAWMNPPRLPMPETFKEPGYPVAIAALTPLARDPFRAAQLISLLAGLLLPFAVYALGRRLAPDPWVGVLAGVLTAASPVLILQSAYVMAESAFALMLTLALLAAAPRAGEADAWERVERASIHDVLAGVMFGLAFLIRAQAALAIPAMIALLVAGRAPRVRVLSLLLAAFGALFAIAPLVARNLRLFGVPFHSDVAAFGLWPYVDQFALTHSLERPPSAIGFALGHPAAVAATFARSLGRFLTWSLPHELLGHALWLAPLAIGLWISVRRIQVWAFAWLLLVPTATFILSLNWVARYFAGVTPVFCLLVALGAVAIHRRLTVFERSNPRTGRIAIGLAMAIVIAVLGIQVTRTVRHADPGFAPEIQAARHEAGFLRARLAPGETVMAEMTSYWAWFSDRPAVYPVVADEARFDEVMRRLRVRYAALPTSRLEEFASRYPGRRLPASLRRDHEDRERDVTVFEVKPER